MRECIIDETPEDVPLLASFLNKRCNLENVSFCRQILAQSAYPPLLKQVACARGLPDTLRLSALLSLHNEKEIVEFLSRKGAHDDSIYPEACESLSERALGELFAISGEPQRGYLLSLFITSAGLGSLLEKEPSEGWGDAILRRLREFQGTRGILEVFPFSPYVELPGTPLRADIYTKEIEDQMSLYLRGIGDIDLRDLLTYPLTNRQELFVLARVGRVSTTSDMMRAKSIRYLSPDQRIVYLRFLLDSPCKLLRSHGVSLIDSLPEAERQILYHFTLELEDIDLGLQVLAQAKTLIELRSIAKALRRRMCKLPRLVSQYYDRREGELALL